MILLFIRWHIEALVADRFLPCSAKMCVVHFCASQYLTASTSALHNFILLNVLEKEEPVYINTFSFDCLQHFKPISDVLMSLGT